MKNLIASVVVALSMVLSTPLHAAEHLVADAPEFDRAVKAAQPGDVILLQDGAWRDVTLEFKASGEAGRPITLRAQTPGAVTLGGQSSLTIEGKFLVVDGLSFREGYLPKGHVIRMRGSDNRVTNCAVVDYNPPLEGRDPEATTFYISLYGQGMEVDHCYFKGKNNPGPMFVVWVEDQPNAHHVHHNRFAGRPSLGRNGGETMRIGTSQVSMNNSRTLVEDNYFDHCDGEAEFISNKSCENVYRRNTFVENKGALVMRHGNRCTVEGNWFFGNGVEGTGGIRLIGEDHKVFNNYLDRLAGKEFESALPFVNGIPNSKLNEYFRIQRALVAHNTLVDCAQNVTFGIGVGRRNRAEPPMDCIIAANVIVASPGATTQPAFKFDDRPINTTWTGNVLSGLQPGDLPDGVVGSGVVVTERIKVERDDRGIARVSGLAAGDSGAATSVVSEDIEGKPRPASSRSPGCFEPSSDATARYRPLTPGDVGPGWMRSDP